MMFTRVSQAILLVGAIATSTAASAADEWQVRTSPYSVPETLTRLTAAIEGAGARIAAVMDHADVAAEADIEREPTTVVIFDDPENGSPARLEEDRIGLNLPLRILVWEDGGATMVGYVDPGGVSTRYEMVGDSSSVVMIEAALERLTNPGIT